MPIAIRTHAAARPRWSIAVFGVLLLSFVPISHARTDKPDSIHRSGMHRSGIDGSRTHADGLRLTVLDRASGRPLPQIAVRIDSDNGIRCIKAPCPSHAMQWTGRTDNKGVIAVPARVVQASMTITASRHSRGKNLAHDASKTTPHDWVIALDPDR